MSSESRPSATFALRIKRDIGNGAPLLFEHELHEFTRIMDIKDLFRKREMPADEEKPNADQYAPLYEEPEDLKLFKVVRKLVDLGAEFDIKACGLHITNTN